MINPPFIASRHVSARPPPGADPQPPFQVRGVEMVYLEGRIDPRYARGLLPDWLTPSESGAIDIAIYTAPDAWGPKPFAACYVRIALSGHFSPDGGSAVFTLAQTMSSPAATIFARHYDSECVTGTASVRTDPDTIDAEGELPFGARVLIRTRRTHGPVTATAGSYPTIARHGDGYVEYTTAHSCLIEPLALEEFQWSVPPGHPLQILRDHFEPIEVALLREKSFACGVPRPVLGDQSGQSDPAPALIDLISRLNLPALVFQLDGRLVHVSAAAEQLGPGLDSVVQLVRQRALRRADASTFQDRSLPLTLPDGQTEVIRLIPLAQTLWGQPVVLCVLADLARFAASDPVPVLGLIGLTPAEARITGLLARGFSAPRVAADLGLSPHTVRSALKGIYGKLGINSRAELATVVDRLMGHRT